MNHRLYQALSPVLGSSLKTCDLSIRTECTIIIWHLHSFSPCSFLGLAAGSNFSPPSTVLQVPDLFQAIRDATQEASTKRPGLGALWDDMADDQCTAKAFYEVLYIGRVIVHGEKITSHYVDDLAEKFESKEPDLLNNTVVEEEEKRNRHASGASVKSLPANLEGSVTVTENDLGRQHEKLGYGDESVDSSADDMLGCGQIGGSSTEILDCSGSVHSNGAPVSCPSQDSIEGPSSTPRLSQPCTDVSNLPTQGNGTQVQLPVYSKADRNRTMLFRLGQNEITLISPDLKSSMLERKFKDIPSVSQVSFLILSTLCVRS